MRAIAFIMAGFVIGAAVMIWLSRPLPYGLDL